LRRQTTDILTATKNKHVNKKANCTFYNNITIKALDTRKTPSCSQLASSLITVADVQWYRVDTR